MFEAFSLWYVLNGRKRHHPRTHTPTIPNFPHGEVICKGRCAYWGTGRMGPTTFVPLFAWSCFQLRWHIQQRRCHPVGLSAMPRFVCDCLVESCGAGQVGLNRAHTVLCTFCRRRALRSHLRHGQQLVHRALRGGTVLQRRGSGRYVHYLHFRLLLWDRRECLYRVPERQVHTDVGYVTNSDLWVRGSFASRGCCERVVVSLSCVRVPTTA